MDPWTPATREKVDLLLAVAIARLEQTHRKRFEAALVPPRAVPVTDSPGETVLVVAEYEGRIIYWSDIEEGWECELPNKSGGIDNRGCNQFELLHIVRQIFGVPDAQ